jgi:two-component system cell cycle response regulator DivK
MRAADAYPHVSGTRRVGGVVLLVDDLAETRLICQEYLEREGYIVHTVSNGREALEAAPELQPDVIIMDLWMPIMDGWEATRRLKRDLRTRAIPLVVLSGRALRQSEMQARHAGCDVFLPKPCLPGELIAAVEEARKLRARSRCSS